MKVTDTYDQHGIRTRTLHWDERESTAKPLTDLSKEALGSMVIEPFGYIPD